MLSVVIRAMEVVFMVGAIGSALVILLAFAEDLIEIWRDDERKGGAGQDKAA